MTAEISRNGYAMVPQPHGGALQRWPKGVSGNPQGKQARPIAKLLQRCNTREEAESLVHDYLELCHSRNQRVRLDALIDLFDRLWPRDPSGKDGLTREILIREYQGLPERVE